MPAARYDVVVEPVERRTQYRILFNKFPALPAWIKVLGLPGGLCLRLSRRLLYFASEVECPDRFASHPRRLTYTVRLEMARALANALDLDYYHSQIVWILSASTVSFLEEFSATPNVEMPAYGSHAACSRGIHDTVALCRTARTLPDEYLFERFHVPSGEWFRWAFFTSVGFVAAQAFSGLRRGGRPVFSGHHRGPREPNAPVATEYVGGLGPE